MMREGRYRKRLRSTMGRYVLIGEQQNGKWRFSCAAWPDLAAKFNGSEDVGACVDEFERRVKAAKGRDERKP